MSIFNKVERLAETAAGWTGYTSFWQLQKEQEEESVQGSSLQLPDIWLITWASLHGSSVYSTPTLTDHVITHMYSNLIQQLRQEFFLGQIHQFLW